MVIFGGLTSDNCIVNEVYLFDLMLREWIPVSNEIEPSPRVQHTCVNAPGSKSMVLFGGYTRNMVNDVWMFNYENLEWAEMKCNGNIPSKRSGHTSVVFNESMIVYGGNCVGPDGKNRLCGLDIYELDLRTWVWRVIDVKPSIITPQPSYNHSAVIVGSEMFVFGGWNGITSFRKLNVFDLKLSTWTTIEYNDDSLISRRDHCAIIAGSLYIFGGFSDHEGNRTIDNKMHNISLGEHNFVTKLLSGHFLDVEFSFQGEGHCSCHNHHHDHSDGHHHHHHDHQ